MGKKRTKRRQYRKRNSRKRAGMMELSPDDNLQMPLDNSVGIILRDLKQNIKLVDYPFISKSDFNKVLKNFANDHKDDFSESGYSLYGRNLVIVKCKKHLNRINLLLRAEKSNQDRAKRMYVRGKVLTRKSRLYNQHLPYKTILKYLD